MLRRRTVLALALALVPTVGCRKRRSGSQLVVLGAASLIESLTAVAEAWTAQGGTEVTLVFGSTSQLARQTRAGAPADVFVSADEAWMDSLIEAGAVRADTRRDLLTNRMVVAVPREAAFVPEDLAQLEATAVETVAVAGENVPAGRYADAVIAGAGRTEALRPKLARGDSVRTVLHWVAVGEVDAGFVYATDALADERVRVAFEISASLQPAISYPIAVVAHAEHPSEAARFVEFCSSPAARAVFEAAGFGVVEA